MAYLDPGYESRIVLYSLIAWPIEPALIFSSASSYKAFAERPFATSIFDSLSPPKGEQPESKKKNANIRN